MTIKLQYLTDSHPSELATLTIRQYREILGKQRTIQPIHANEGQRKQLIRTYRMDKHYIPGKLIFFMCFHLCLNPILC
jgi:hypothetical protein